MTNHKHLLFLLPALLFMALTFLFPLFQVLIESLTDAAGSFSVEAYKSEVFSPLFAKFIRNTLTISILCTVFTLCISYPIAFHLSRQSARRRAVLLSLVMLPFWTSILVKSFAFTALLGESGTVNKLIQFLLGEEFSVKLLFNRTGVIIGMVHHFIPFMVLPILGSLLAQDTNLTNAAKIMGAGNTRIFWKITLPLSLPGVFAGVFLTLILSIGFFVTPALLGGPKDQMIAQLVDIYAQETLNWTGASAISVVLFVMSVFLIAIMSRMPGGQSIWGSSH
ncbi:ABC transporter permease [Ruegeria atlantica]|uniref:ABC transporter permease n=1 Tax=Ruegeria atlantica TaxID=81569 RepID=UPI001480CEA7|nr:ABC transporter permease [Ruegeria atlantica]